jgi:hypothetical protein
MRAQNQCVRAAPTPERPGRGLVTRPGVKGNARPDGNEPGSVPMERAMISVHASNTTTLGTALRARSTATRYCVETVKVARALFQVVTCLRRFLRSLWIGAL